MQFKDLWPTGSLERQLALNFPGCKSLLEAVKKKVQENHELKELKKSLAQVETASQTTPKQGELSDSNEQEEDFTW